MSFCCAVYRIIISSEWRISSALNRGDAAGVRAALCCSRLKTGDQPCADAARQWRAAIRGCRRRSARTSCHGPVRASESLRRPTRRRWDGCVPETIRPEQRPQPARCLDISGIGDHSACVRRQQAAAPAPFSGVHANGAIRPQQRQRRERRIRPPTPFTIPSRCM